MKKPFFLILILLNSSCSSIKFLNDYSSLSNSTSSYSTDNANLQNWHNLDPEIDAIPGTSVERAYKELLKDLDGNKVIVAIIDTGLDIEHENLSNNIWINNNEIVNGLDDDNNGYVDDINGWNYLGSSYNETREMTRLLRDNKVNNRKYSLVEEEIKKEIKKTKNGFSITMQSTVLQKDVFLSTRNKGHFTDNYFDVLPNESVTIEFKTTSKSLEDLKIKTLNSL